MCFGGGAENGPIAGDQYAGDPAQQVLDQEALRQSNVMLGKGKIDTAFKQFDDPYYASYKEAYKGNYIPQIDEQYTTAVGKMMAQLAKRGIDLSSIGAAKQGKLASDYVDAKTTIAGEAESAANALRGNVENTKSNLYALNTSSADPAAADAQALAQAKTLVAPPQYSPIGDVFASALQPFNNFQAAQNNTPNQPAYKSPFTTKRSTGSSTVVK